VAERIVVGKLSEIPVGGNRVITVGKKDIAVFNVGGELFAIDDMCPHMGASLSGGHVEDGCVTCPWHYWRFRLTDGTWADSPRLKIGSYPVHIVGDEVHLEIPG
jgi:nitrite reductase (NADH) small subunit/3-phenylpropionate/trans-cinnamate dioxygenase ferredoxin subunit